MKGYVKQLILSTLLSLYSNLFIATQDYSYEIPLLLQVNGEPRGEVSARLKDDGSIQSLESIRIQEELEQLWETDFSWQETPLWISTEDLESRGLILDYNPVHLSIAITVAPAIQIANGLSFDPGENTYQGTPIYPRPFSAYLNLWGNHQYQQYSTPEEVMLWEHRLQGELVLNTGGLVWEFRQTWEYDQQEWEKLWLSLEADLENMTITAGSYSLPVHGFQQPGIYQGIRIESKAIRENSQPEQESFIVEDPTTLTVLVNGRQIQRMNLQPGKYFLSDFPFYSGLNQVELYFQSHNGKEDIQRFSQSFDSSILAKAQQHYGYFIGMEPWTALEGVKGSFFHSLGLGCSMELELNGQWQDQQTLAGLRWTWASPLGNLRIDPALALNQWSLQGWAVRTRYLLQFNSYPRAPQISTSLGYRSEEFIPGGTDLVQRWEWASSINQRLGSHVQGGLSLNYRDYWNEAEPQWVAAGRFSLQPRAGVTLTASYRSLLPYYNTENSSLTLLLQFSDYRRNSSVSVRQDMIQQGQSLDWQRSLSDGRIAMSAGFSMEDYDAPQYSLRGAMDLRGNRLNGGTGLEWSQGYNGGSARLNYGTALVYTAGHGAISTPVQDSFALFVAAPGTGSYPMGLNPSPDYESTGGWLGPAVLNSLNAGRPESVIAEPLNLPPEDFLLFPQSQFLLLPENRSGLLVELGEAPGVNLEIQFQKDTNSWEWGTGTITSQDEQLWFFSDETGLAEIYNLKPGTYIIETRDYESLTIELIDEQRGSTVQLQVELIPRGGTE